MNESLLECERVNERLQRSPVSADAAFHRLSLEPCEKSAEPTWASTSIVRVLTDKHAPMPRLRLFAT